VSHHSDLIDTTEMYLRTVYELEEEGVVPLRARIAERLGQTGPTVSQTVARMERDGLLHVADDRHLQLTERGRHEAISVMRKHRLAERLLSDVIGLDWEDLHVEACRWEHVMSEAVERRIVAMLTEPMICPHGNPIPGLEELGVPAPAPASDPAPADPGPPLVSLTDAGASAAGAARLVLVDRISEQLQPDVETMRTLSSAGLRPGRRVRVRLDTAGLEVSAAGVATIPRSRAAAGSDGPGDSTVLPPAVADHVFVRVL
jgi:DtxR family transcriptional regulator, Mn-dependent transcriptional regulator